VLRCEGCSVLHHPGCWVTNGGCATETEHRVAPSAMAYSGNDRAASVPGGHPGEGTRLAPVAAPASLDPPEPIPFRPVQRPVEAAVPDDGPVIGAPPAPQPTIHRTLPSTVGQPASPRRYQPPPGEQMPRKTMPQIYDRHRIFEYWYVPAAVLLALFVAVSVVWSVGKLTGGSDSNKADQVTPTAEPGGGLTTPVPSASAPASPAASQTPGPSTGPGKFKGGDAVVVTGTGDCLNVRVKAGRENDAIVCVKDGTELKITAGPETASELTWWKVRTELGEGWAAEDYLVKKP